MRDWDEKVMLVCNYFMELIYSNDENVICSISVLDLYLLCYASCFVNMMRQAFVKLQGSLLSNPNS